MENMQLRQENTFVVDPLYAHLLDKQIKVTEAASASQAEEFVPFAWMTHQLGALVTGSTIK